MTRQELIAKLSERSAPHWVRFPVDGSNGHAFATCDFCLPTIDDELTGWLNALDETDREVHVQVSRYHKSERRVRVLIFCYLEDAPVEEVQ